MKNIKKVALIVLFIMLTCVLIISIVKDGKSSDIVLEYKDYTFQTIEFEEIWNSAGNIIFTEKKVNNQVMVLAEYEEYVEYMEKYADKIAINNSEMQQELDNSKLEFEDGNAAIVIYYDKLATYGFDLCLDEDVLYVELESMENKPITIYYDEEEIQDYKSRAMILFIEKEIIDSLSKVAIIDKQ